MNEKYKNLFKKLGLAGFLFFLIKGILWLIFGTALFKWLKGCIVTGALLSLPLCICGQQSMHDSLYTAFMNSSNPIIKTRSLHTNQTCKRAFFCKLEDNYLQKNILPISFRLGSSNYTNSLEYPNQWQSYKPGIEFKRTRLND